MCVWLLPFAHYFFGPKNGKEGDRITCKYFTYEDRKHFEEQYNAGAALPDIADTLGVHISTIYRELNRGSTGEIDANDRAGYDAELAQKTMPEGLSARRRKYNLIRNTIIAATCLFAVAAMIAILK